MSRRTREIAQSALTTKLLELMHTKHDIGEHEQVQCVELVDFEQAVPQRLHSAGFEVWFFAEYVDGLATADMPEAAMPTYILCRC